MNRIYSNEYKLKIFEENREWLTIVYHIGKGLMLRQQMVIFAVEYIGMNKIQAEVALSALNNAGMVLLAKTFANCTNKVVCYSKYLIAAITGVDIKQSWVPKFSTSNILYYTYKTELMIEYLRRVGKVKFKKNIEESLVLLSKNNGKKIYQWFDMNETLKTKTLFNQDCNMTQSITVPIEKIVKRSENFNFNKFLANNFLVNGILNNNKKEERILELYYLRVSRTKMHTFYELLKCMLVMFKNYFEDINNAFKTINVTIVFFNDKELNAFKKNWSEKIFKKHIGAENNYLSEILTISYRSIDLDKRYNLSRDI